MRRSIPWVACFAALTALGCRDEVPTSIDGGLIPLDPVSFEVRIPWSEFGSALRVLGGFGSPSELGRGVLADDFGGELQARTLFRFASFPLTATVTDTTGTQRPDTALTFLGGAVIAVIDTATSRVQGPITVRAGALPVPWHSGSASWDFAVDTLNARVAWPEPGAGPVRPLGSAVWDPAEGDSLEIPLDSATVASLNDTAAVARGIRLEVDGANGRLEVLTAFIRLRARPSIRPDTTITVAAAPTAFTFVYRPVPGPPAGGMRLGGVPAWRTIFRVELPDEVTPPPGFCSRVGCPLALSPRRISQAALVLQTRATEPGFQPGDTVRIDVRTVLVPDRLPKSPLGPSLVGILGERVVARAFGETPGQKVEIGITGFVRGLLEEAEEEGAVPARTLALLSLFEPASIGYGAFAGPGEEGEPYLRLVITVSDPMQVR